MAFHHCYRYTGKCINFEKRSGAEGGLRTHGLLRERIASRHDPVISCDLKSAAFDRAWLLPQRWWAAPDLNQRPSMPKSVKLDWVLGVNETS